MIRAMVLFVPVLVLIAGCGETKPTPVPTDPNSIKMLEDQQKKASRGE